MTIEASKKCQIAVMMAYFTAYLTILITDLQPLSAYGDIIELVGIGLALLAFVTGIRAHVKKNRLPWICFTLTALCSLLGEGLWSYYDHVLGIDPGSPSLCDVFFVTCILFCITGSLLHFPFYVASGEEVQEVNPPGAGARGPHRPSQRPSSYRCYLFFPFHHRS